MGCGNGMPCDAKMRGLPWRHLKIMHFTQWSKQWPPDLFLCSRGFGFHLIIAHGFVNRQ